MASSRFHFEKSHQKEWHMTQNMINPQPLLLTMDQVTQVLNLQRTKIYELIRDEGLPVQRFGRSIRFSYEDLQQWLKDRQKQAC